MRLADRDDDWKSRKIMKVIRYEPQLICKGDPVITRIFGPGGKGLVTGSNGFHDTLKLVLKSIAIHRTELYSQGFVTIDVITVDVSRPLALKFRLLSITFIFERLSLRAY